METYVDEPNFHPMARVDVATEPRGLNLKYILTQTRTTHPFIAVYVTYLVCIVAPRICSSSIHLFCHLRAFY